MSKIEQRGKGKGFTIIEVVLVLAIAGLIFLMVFTALPALQRSQRDTARKSDVANVVSAVTTYGSNNRGAFPTAANLTTASILTDVSNNTTSVTVQAAGTLAAAPADGIITITQKTTCGASAVTSQTLVLGTTRQYTVVTKLEGSGGTYFCQNS